MTTRRTRAWHAVLVVTVLCLGGLVALAALSVRPSSATSFGEPRSATVDAGESSGAEPVKVRTDARRHVELVTATTFDEQVLRASVPVLVDFYADWCVPCQVQGRILEEFAAESAGAKIVKVNVDQDAELAERFQVEGLPTLLIVKDGRVIDRHVGLATKATLRSALAP